MIGMTRMRVPIIRNSSAKLRGRLINHSRSKLWALDPDSGERFRSIDSREKAFVSTQL
jgi:hypothetical protein